MAKFCTNCGSAMDDAAVFCSKCGKGSGSGAPGFGTTPTAAPVASAGGLTDNVAGLLAYLFVPAIIFLVIEPYNRSRFIRFHSFQCIFTVIALMIIHAVLWVIPFVGWMLSGLISLLTIALVIILMIQAYNGKMWKLPVIGDIAEKQANA